MSSWAKLHTRVAWWLLLFAASFLSFASAALEWDRERGSYLTDEKTLSSLSAEGLKDFKAALVDMNKARVYQDAGSYWRALSAYKKVTENFPESLLAPEAHYQRALVYTKRHQFDNARESYGIIFSRYPSYEKTEEVLSSFYQTAEYARGGARPYLWGLIPWLRDPKGISELYRAVIDHAPASNYAPKSLLGISKVYRDKSPQKSIDGLDELIARYPESRYTPEAYIEIGKIYASLYRGEAYDQGALARAMDFYEDYLLLYPARADTTWVKQEIEKAKQQSAQSKYLIGEFYAKGRKELKAALIFYHEAITLAPQTPVAKAAREQVDFIHALINPPPLTWQEKYSLLKKSSEATYYKNNYRFVSQFTSDFFTAEDFKDK